MAKKGCTPEQIAKIDDLVELNPFEVAVNRTCLAVITLGTTKFAIQAMSWAKIKGKLGRFSLLLRLCNRDKIGTYASCFHNIISYTFIREAKMLRRFFKRRIEDRIFNYYLHNDLPF